MSQRSQARNRLFKLRDHLGRGTLHQTDAGRLSLHVDGCSVAWFGSGRFFRVFHPIAGERQTRDDAPNPEGVAIVLERVKRRAGRATP